MRLPFLVLASALVAAPLPGQRLGERTVSPEAMLAGFDGAAADEALAAQVAAADAHPLGTADNPVRVGGPEGERAYLARLRCPDGAAPRIGAREEAGVGAFGSVVSAYGVTCGGPGGPSARIVIDPYHAEHREDRPPPDFSIQPL